MFREGGEFRVCNVQIVAEAADLEALLLPGRLERLL